MCKPQPETLQASAMFGLSSLYLYAVSGDQDPGRICYLGLGFGAWGLGFRVWGLGFRASFASVAESVLRPPLNSQGEPYNSTSWFRVWGL